MMPIRVLIADDQPLQRDGFRMVLESQPDIEVVGEAGDGIQLLRVARRMPADVVLMDLQMPRMNGIVAAERMAADPRILAHGNAARVVLLTAVDLDDHLPDAAAAGVFAVLYKDTDPRGLLDTIRAAALGPGSRVQLSDGTQLSGGTE